MSVFKIRPAVPSVPSSEDKPKVRPLFEQKAKELEEKKEQTTVKRIVPAPRIPQPTPPVEAPRVKVMSPPPAPSGPVKRVLFADKAITNNTDGLPAEIVSHPIMQGLEPMDIRRAIGIQRELDITNTKDLFKFGDHNRAMFADIVNKMVDAAKQSALQQANDALATVCVTLGSVQFSNLLKQEDVGFFGSLFGKKKDFCLKSTIEWFDRVTTQTDQELMDLDSAVTGMANQIDQLEQLHHQNKDDFRLLQIQIAAGTLFIDRTKKDLDGNTSTDPLVLSDLQYRKMCLDRFESKVAELQMTAQDVILNSPQIRLMQLNIQDLSERTKKVRDTIYPRWKGQFTKVVTALQNSINSDKSTDFEAILKKHSDVVGDFAQTQSQLNSLR